MKIILADNSELVRIGLRTVIRVSLPNSLVYDARNHIELQNLFQLESNITIVIIDYTAESFSLRQIADLKQKYPQTYFIALTYLQSGKTIETSLRAGINSYVKKDCNGKEIIEAVRKTLEGIRFFCKDIIKTIQQDAIDIDKLHFDPTYLAEMVISSREKDIICLIAQGLTNNEIADKLFLSTHTVNTHRRNIMEKLGVHNTAGIVMYAVKANLVQPNKFLFSS